MAEPLVFKALKELNRLVSHYTDDAAETERLIAAIAAVPGRSVDQKVKAIKAGWKRKGTPNTSSETLRRLVEQGHMLFSVTGPKSLQNDLSKLKTFLGTGETVAVEEFLARLKIDPAPARQTRTAQKRLQIDPLKFSDELVRCLDRQSDFDALVRTLTEGRTYTLAQINDVARNFLGYDVKFRNKTKAAEALKRRQVDMAIGGAQLEQIDNLPV